MTDTKFKKGVSGNPSGRPKKDTANLKPLLAKHGESVLQTVVDAALGGDLTACKLILDRLYPPIKPQSSTVSIKAGQTPVEQGEAIIKATLDGEVSPDVSQVLMSGLASQLKLVDQEEFERRIEALEAERGYKN